MARECIAVVTDDGQRVAAHFGRASAFVVFVVEDGRIVARETRQKPTVPHNHEHTPEAIRMRVQRMVEPVADCQVLIAGGMGRPAYARLTEQGYRVYLASGSVEEVVQAYLDGRLQSDLRRLHEPHGHHGHKHAHGAH